MKTLQDRLRAELNKRGRGAISELARYVGVNPQTARTWVADGVNPHEDRLIKIAEFLEVTPHWLRYGEMAPAKPPARQMEPVLEYLVEDEHLLIQDYRRCTSEGKHMIRTSARVAEKTPVAELLRRHASDN